MLIEGPPGPHGPAVSILLKKCFAPERNYTTLLSEFNELAVGGVLTELCLFRVFQVPQAYKDPQAPLEILVTG